MYDSPLSLGRWQVLWMFREDFINGFLCTLQVSVLGLILAITLGVVFGIFSASKSRILKGISRVYVEIFQNTPLVIQFFFYYNGLPYMGLDPSKFTIGVLGMGIYTGAYMSEVVRTGIQSIDKGQFEAAKSQGFTGLQTMFYIILPQTLRTILPPMTNQAGNLVRNSSVLAMIAGGDIMNAADSWASTTLNYAPAYIVAGLMYFSLCYLISKLTQYLEKKLNHQVSVPRKRSLVRVQTEFEFHERGRSVRK